MGDETPRLKLANDLYSAASAGRKKATVRFGWRDIRPGPMVLEPVEGDYAMAVTVKAVTFTEFGRLTTQHALDDGFASLNDLQDALRRFYPSIAGADPVTVIAW